MRPAPPVHLLDAFAARFREPARVAARAPGRVNLIGEHTDYNGGLVLPCAIDRDTWVLASPAPGKTVRVVALDLDAEADFEVGREARQGDFADYVQGVTWALGERGHTLGGGQLLVSSQVPRAAGLSSSAALELAVAAALDGLWGLSLAPLDWARVAHRAECDFAGVACGIMDQFASGLGRIGHALRIDCASEQVAPIPMPEGFRLLVAQSGVERRLAASGYNERVAECARALAAARDAKLAKADADSLRGLEDVPLAELERVLDPVAARRVRHVLSENRRVDAFCRALASGDLDGAGRLLVESQASLRDDYQVSVPELDALCEIADAQAGVFGSRLTGAGFGGCTLHLVAREAAAAVSKALADGFEGRFGRRPESWTVAPAAGASCQTLA
ncbi:MAG: galactokinase [Proteobacteria bacterium]|nr:galactokinase [Pseudomonadota bacterium]